MKTAPACPEFLKGEDFLVPKVFTIKEISLKNFSHSYLVENLKAIIEFEEDHRWCRLSRRLHDVLVELFGDGIDVSELVGKQVELFAEKSGFNGHEIQLVGIRAAPGHTPPIQPTCRRGRRAMEKPVVKPFPEDLQTVIDSWIYLPKRIRAGIVQIVK